MKKLVILLALTLLQGIIFSQTVLPCGEPISHEQDPIDGSTIPEKEWIIDLGNHSHGVVIIDFFTHSVPDNYQVYDTQGNLLLQSGWLGGSCEMSGIHPDKTSWERKKCNQGFVLITQDSFEFLSEIPSDFRLQKVHTKASGAGRMILEVGPDVRWLKVVGQSNPTEFTIWNFVVSCTTCQELLISGSRELCEGETLSLSGTRGYEQYIWYQDDLFISTHRLLEFSDVDSSYSGRYRVIARTKGLCSDTAWVDVTVHPAIHAEMQGPSKLCHDEYGLLEVLATGGTPPYEYEWSNGVKAESFQLLGDFNSGHYEVTVTDAARCTVTDSIDLISCCQPEFFLPNAFTPNNDGVNEELILYLGQSTKWVRNIHMFSRWGDHIYNNVGITEGGKELFISDGNFKGKALPQGVYVIIFEIACYDSNAPPRQISKNVTIIR